MYYYKHCSPPRLVSLNKLVSSSSIIMELQYSPTSNRRLKTEVAERIVSWGHTEHHALPNKRPLLRTQAQPLSPPFVAADAPLSMRREVVLPLCRRLPRRCCSEWLEQRPPSWSRGLLPSRRDSWRSRLWLAWLIYRTTGQRVLFSHLRVSSE